MTADELMRQIEWYRNARIEDHLDARRSIIRKAIESFIADRDQLAAGVLVAYTYVPDISNTFNQATGVARRLKLAAAPAKPEHSNIQCMPRVAGKLFRCECGCNVFTKLSPARLRCNSCGGVYLGQLASSPEPTVEPAAAPAKPESTDDYDLVVVTDIKSDAWRYRRGSDFCEHTSLASPLDWTAHGECRRSDWCGNHPGYRKFSSWAEAEKWIAGDKSTAQPAGEPVQPAEPADPEYDLVEVHPDGRAWRYRPGQNRGEWTQSFPDDWESSATHRASPITDGAIRFASMPAALAWWRSTHPEPIQPATQPAGKPTLSDTQRRMNEVFRKIDNAYSSAKTASKSSELLTIDAIRALARVVDELAEEER